MIKLNCIDQQHAEIARLQLIGMGRKAVVAGKAVISTGEYDNKVVRVKVEALAYTDDVTDWDVEYLGGES